MCETLVELNVEYVSKNCVRACERLEHRYNVPM